MYITNEQKIDLNNLELLSDKGSECVVYKYNNKAIKIFRKEYIFSHLTIEEIYYLSQIPTKRILFPIGSVLDNNHKVAGYTMHLITDEKNIQKESMKRIFYEMQIIQKDLNLLSKHNICLFDIGQSNCIYNGKLFLIDPGNYIINNMSNIKKQLDPLNLCSDNKLLLKTWNENKINQLFDSLLFSQNANIDSYQHRLIVQFFQKEKDKKKINYNLDVFKEFFDENMTVENAVLNFMQKHIKEDEKERSWYLSSREK